MNPMRHKARERVERPLGYNSRSSSSWGFLHRRYKILEWSMNSTSGFTLRMLSVLKVEPEVGMESLFSKSLLITTLLLDRTG